MKLSRVPAALALALAVSGCASFPGSTYELDQLERTTPDGSPFSQALSREYLAYARAERVRYDWGASQHFAHKGLAAAHGSTPPPEDLAEWTIADQSAASQMAEARARLVEVLATGAPAHLPALTATAQVKFDCWVEHLADDRPAEDVAACRKDFYAAMDAIAAQARPAAATR